MEEDQTPNIRPISELRSNFAEISRIAHETAEPIFLTKNGYGDLAVLSIEAFEALQGKEGEKAPEAETRSSK